MHQPVATNETLFRCSHRAGQPNLIVNRCVCTKTWIGHAIGAFVLICASAGAAAADSSLPVPTKAAIVTPPAFDWSGAYFGGHFSYSLGHTTDTLFDPTPTPSSKSLSSFYGGLQLGYNYVIRSGLMLGIEGDISFPYFLDNGLISSKTTSLGTTVTEQIDYVATLRTRFGYAFDRWLPYMTGGFAWSQARFVESPGLVQDEDKILRTRPGWVAGLGTEVALAPDWTARLEYLYCSFDGVDGTFPSGVRYGSAFDTHTLRLGLNHELSGPEAGPPLSGSVDWWPLTSDNWNIHGQLTYVEQGYPGFRSPYQGPQSLSGAGQIQNTTSGTAFLGFRLWDGGELYVNPEIMQGFGLSDTLGLAGFPNGEAQKSNFPMPRVDMARVYLQQTFGLGGEKETTEDGPNQLAGERDISRVTITAGRFEVIDFFDGNAFSHDPRRDFLNWNMYCCGSYDLTMDKVSYTWGTFVELNQKYWALRTGYFLVPTVSNANTYDTDIPDRGEYTTELELRYSLYDQPGKVRLFGWLNRAVAGSYAEAVALPMTSPNYPDITLTRRVRNDYGFVINLEQAVTNDLGLFSRATWNPGQTEIIGWTDCDESLSIGAVLKGALWGRLDDKVGLGVVVEGLSPEARAYFAAGGLGILIGDGQLNYQPEKILEAYYAYILNKWATLTLDYQFVADPAYNADRGPVSIFAARFHAEF
jgi:high affinity Mn2+ porin